MAGEGHQEGTPSLVNRPTRFLVAAIAGVSMLTLTGCGDYGNTTNDQVGLYYTDGDSDGHQFVEVIKPGGEASSTAINDDIFYVPVSLRNWEIDARAGSDQAEPVVVLTLDGVELNVFSNTNFKLNSNEDDVPNFPGGTVRKWWEALGARFEANTDGGWDNMLRVTIVPALKGAQTSVLQRYNADDILGNKPIADGPDKGKGTKEVAQRDISALFQANLEKQAGGKFFCGPSFDRDVSENVCPPVETLLTTVVKRNPELQAAADRKRAAQDVAAAQLIEAQGKAQAAALLAKSVQDPKVFALELEKIRAQAIAACGTKCVVVMGGTEGISVRVE